MKLLFWASVVFPKSNVDEPQWILSLLIELELLFLTFQEVNKLFLKTIYSLFGKVREAVQERQDYYLDLQTVCLFRFRLFFTAVKSSTRLFKATWCQVWLWLSSCFYGNKLSCHQGYIATFCIATGQGKTVSASVCLIHIVKAE